MITTASFTALICILFLHTLVQGRRDRSNDPSQLRVTTTQRCAPGYCVLDGQCLKAHIVDPEYRCPIGHEEVDGKCIWHKPLSQVGCSRGIPTERCRQEGLDCVCESSATMVAECPDGATFDGELCAMSAAVPENCSKGLTMIDDQMCAQIIPRELTCPKGFQISADNRGCERRDVVEGEMVCPANTRRDGSKCVQKIKVKAVCNPGDIDIGNGCARIHNKRHACPDGMLLDQGRCIRVSIAEKRGLCPNGGDPDNDCAVLIDAPMSAFCPEGTLIDSVCVKEERSTALAECPEGYFYDEEQCKKEVPYDCSLAEWSLECEDPPVCEDFSEITTNCVPVCKRRGERDCLPNCNSEFHDPVQQADANGACVIEADFFGRNLRETNGRKRSRISHNRIAKDGQLPLCHRVPVLKSKMCSQMVRAEAAPYCKEGIYRGDGQCVRRVQRNSESVCEGEIGADGRCTMIQKSDLVYGCEIGFTAVGNRCESVISAEPDTLCVEGEEMDGQCVTMREKRCDTDDCTTVAESDAVTTCPMGFARSGNNRCERVEFSKPLERCPKNSEPYGEYSCAVVVEQVGVSSVTVLRAQFTCPIGTHSRGSKCVREDRFLLGEQCSESGESCHVESEMVRACPTGAREQHGHCFVIASTSSYEVDTLVEGKARRSRKDL